MKKILSKSRSQLFIGTYDPQNIPQKPLSNTQKMYHAVRPKSHHSIGKYQTKIKERELHFDNSTLIRPLREKAEKVAIENMNIVIPKKNRKKHIVTRLNLDPYSSQPHLPGYHSAKFTISKFNVKKSKLGKHNDRNNSRSCSPECKQKENKIFRETRNSPAKKIILYKMKIEEMRNKLSTLQSRKTYTQEYIKNSNISNNIFRIRTKIGEKRRSERGDHSKSVADEDSNMEHIKSLSPQHIQKVITLYHNKMQTSKSKPCFKLGQDFMNSSGSLTNRGVGHSHTETEIQKVEHSNTLQNVDRPPTGPQLPLINIIDCCFKGKERINHTYDRCPTGVKISSSIQIF